MVTLRHPDLDATYECPPESVHIHEAAGWVRADEPTPKTPKADTATTPEKE
jgi:hypothetical protein